MDDPPRPPAGVPILPSDPGYDDWVAMQGWKSFAFWFCCILILFALTLLVPFLRTGETYTFAQIVGSFIVACAIGVLFGFFFAGLRMKRVDARENFERDIAIPVRIIKEDASLIDDELSRRRGTGAAPRRRR